MGDRSLAGYQQKRVWISDGAGRFVDVAQMVGATDRYDGRSVAVADLSNRGVLDVIVANQRGPLLLYRNDVAPGRAVDRVRARGRLPVRRPPARCTNRSAIGAQVTVFWNGQQQLQEVSGGSGFCAQNQRRLHFGLGPRATIEKAVVRWPSGKMQELARPAGQPRAQDRGTGMTTEAVAGSRAAGSKRPRRCAFDHRYLAPILITCVLVAGQLTFGFLESWSRTFLAIATAIGVELVRRPPALRQVAAPGERLRLGHQRRDAGPLARVLALRAVLGDLDHVEVRPARQGPPHLEPVELRHRRDARPGLRHGRRPQHPVGQQPAADGDRVDVRLGDPADRRPAAHHADLRRVVPASSPCSARRAPAIRSSARSRRSPGRCISCSSSS